MIIADSLRSLAEFKIAQGLYDRFRGDLVQINEYLGDPERESEIPWNVIDDIKLLVRVFNPYATPNRDKYDIFVRLGLFGMMFRRIGNYEIIKYAAARGHADIVNEVIQMSRRKTRFITCALDLGSAIHEAAQNGHRQIVNDIIREAGYYTRSG